MSGTTYAKMQCNVSEDLMVSVTITRTSDVANILLPFLFSWVIC